jgi:trk system potassium uptake protein TrkA
MQQFAVIGLGRFGEHLARMLTRAGAEVIGIDRDPKVVERLRDEVALAVTLDATDVHALASQGVKDVDAAIVGVGEEFESAALTVAALKELGVRRIIARAMTVTQAKILSSVGANETAQAECESANRWAQRLTIPNLQRFVDLGEDHGLVYIKAPDAFCGKTLQDLALRKAHGVNLVAIQRREEGDPSSKASRFIVPVATTVVLADDVLIVVGSNDNLRELPSE